MLEASGHSWRDSVVDSTLWGVALFILAVLFHRWISAADTGSRRNKSSAGAQVPHSEKVLLIVDGCNGPIRLDRDVMLKSHDENALSRSVSFLQVVEGENRQDRIHLVEALNRWVASKEWLGQAELYFDGLGVDKYSKYGLMGRSLDLSEHVRLKVTLNHDEVDNVIVQQVYTRQSITEEDALMTSDHTCLGIQDVYDKFSRGYYRDGWHALIYRRNSNGSGKSRQVVKRFGLMRPGSVFCLFGFSDAKQAARDARTLVSIQRLLEDEVVQRSFQDVREQRRQTLVATDDIFLRQRIVEAGGLVLTFEQLWELLVPFSKGDCR